MPPLLPTLPLVSNIYRGPATVPAIGPPASSPRSNLCPGKRGPFSGINPFLDTWLLLPAGTDIRSTICGGPADQVEVPAGSFRYYTVEFVDDVHRGSAGEFRFAIIKQLRPWPPPGTSPTALNRLVFGIGDQGFSQCAEVGYYTAGGFEYDVVSLAGFSTLASLAVLDSLVWYYLAFTWDGSTQSTYVNGVLDSSQAWTGPLFPAIPSIFWNYITAGNYGSGTYSAVRFYNAALSPAQIIADGLGTIQTGALATYPCTEGSGSTVHDTTGGFDGTLINSPTWSMTCPVGGGVFFDGTLTQRCDCPDTISLLPAWSFTFWYRPLEA